MNPEEHEALVAHAAWLLRQAPAGGDREACEELLAAAQLMRQEGLAPEVALSLFERAGEVAGGSALHEASAAGGAVEALIGLGHPRAALERAAAAVERSRAWPDALRAAMLQQRARAHDACGDGVQARADLAAALELDDAVPGRWMLLAQTAGGERRWDEARAAELAERDGERGVRRASDPAATGRLAPPAPDAGTIIRAIFSPDLAGRARLELWSGSSPRAACTVPFRFALHPRTAERLRWYAEDYPLRPVDPAPRIAADVERELQEIGRELHRQLFAHPEAAAIAAELASARLELVADAHAADALPWELLRDGDADLALSLRGLVRTTTRAQPVAAPAAAGGPVRILLVIARPEGRLDVAFRSVAERLVRALAPHSDRFEIEVLRPPRPERLRERLREARAEGRPFAVVHFDGHGFHDRATGRGVLVFEGDDGAVTGDRVGAALAEAGVQILTMHACRSGVADAEQAYGSVALDALRAGVPGVVAMRFNVFVPTAARFVTELYEALAAGRELAEAVTDARITLAERPEREFVHGVGRLRDWCVPAVYETRRTRLPAARSDAPAVGERAVAVPAAPPHGFVGRD
jgi:hypothetical protein